MRKSNYMKRRKRQEKYERRRNRRAKMYRWSERWEDAFFAELGILDTITFVSSVVLVAVGTILGIIIIPQCIYFVWSHFGG